MNATTAHVHGFMELAKYVRRRAEGETMIGIIDTTAGDGRWLQSFCEDDSGYRRHLKEPFSFGGYTYATNGTIALRIGRNAAFAEAEDSDRIKVVNQLDAMIAERAVLSLTLLRLSLPDAPDAEECERCDGSGLAHPDCSNCACDCTECDGEGEHTTWRRVRFEHFDVSEEKLRQILTLPGLKIAHPADEQSGGPVFFTFDGGEGVVATMTRRSGAHYEGLLVAADYAPAELFDEAQPAEVARASVG